MHIIQNSRPRYLINRIGVFREMLENIRIILASASPRRRELLSRVGIDFEIITSNIEEMTTEYEPDKVVKELSYIKAEDVLKEVIKKNKYSGERAMIVIGADTVVSNDGHIMGKPKSDTEAFDMIHSIQGGTHQVYTGVTIILYYLETKKTRSKSFAECTNVTVFPMTDSEISNYISTGDCMDKAGAYGIQGAFGVFVEKIDGDYNNVVGLPIARLYQEIKNFDSM